MRTGRLRATAWAVIAGLTAFDAMAQQLLDRVVARVNGTPLFLSDVRAAAGLGLVEGADEAEQVRRMVRRQVLLTEVARFPPPEPPAADIAAEVARMTGRLRDAAAFQREQGLSDLEVRSLARDSLRIDAYLAQRFGGTRSTDAIEQWVRDLETRADVVYPRAP